MLVPDPTKRFAYDPAATIPAAPADVAYVPPGRLLATVDAKPLTTIVSTGAVVCVWDPVAGVGGMAHFLLPEVGSAPPAPRFGDVALRTLLDDATKLGAAERRLRARVFGGSAPPVSTEGTHLGDRNIQAAVTFLKSRFVAILQTDSGGTAARKILFDPKGGGAEVARIGPG